MNNNDTRPSPSHHDATRRAQSRFAAGAVDLRDDPWPQITFWPEDEHDPVNHPKHYTAHPSGVECIQITEHMGFCLGNAVKYIWRADLKHDAIEDLRKAAWYIEREIERRTKERLE